jgi:hypothetical protein
MKQFRLSKESTDATKTKFYVYDDDDGSIVGVIKLSHAAAKDFESQWLSGTMQPQAAAFRRKENALVAAMLATGKRENAPAARSKHADPMINAMLEAAPRNRLSQQAILRG